MVNVGCVDAVGGGRRPRRMPVGPFDGLFDPDGSHSAGSYSTPPRAGHGGDQLRRVGSQYPRSLRYRRLILDIQVFVICYISYIEIILKLY